MYFWEVAQICRILHLQTPTKSKVAIRQENLLHLKKYNINVPDHTRTVCLVLRDYRGFKNILQINVIRI
jgi:ABC-type molybdate transport system ATPase subunit